MQRFLAFFLVFFFAQLSHAQNLFVNPDFTGGRVGPDLLIPSWDKGGTPDLGLGSLTPLPSLMPFVNPPNSNGLWVGLYSFKWHPLNVRDWRESIFQTVNNLVVGKTYEVSWLGANFGMIDNFNDPSTGQPVSLLVDQPDYFEVLVNDVPVGTGPTMPLGAGWTSQSVRFVAQSTSAKIAFRPGPLPLDYLRAYLSLTSPSVAVVVAPTPALSLSKSTPSGLTVGAAASYTLTLSNKGTAASGLVDVYEQLPYGLRYTQSSGAACSVVTDDQNGQLLRCSTPAAVAVNATLSFTLTATPDASSPGKSLVNRAQLDPKGTNAVQTPSACVGDGNPAGCAVSGALTVAPAVQSPNLALSKLNPAVLTSGVTSDYSLSVNNSGGATGRVDVYDKLPFGLRYVQSSGADCTLLSDDSTGQLLKCSPGASVGAGASVTMTVTVLPTAALVGSTVRNQARIDTTGANAAQTPGDCVSTGSPAGCAVTPDLTVNPTPTAPGASSFQYTVPTGIFELKASLLGGGGGKGGDDSTSLGGSGGAGGLLTGQIRVTAGQVFQVVVGAGGGSGASGTAVAGGSGGAGGLLNWVYGGGGGPSGGTLTSGSGAGGGGATSLALLSAPSDLLMVAGGGGGGQGGALQASSVVGQAGNGPALTTSALCTVLAGSAGSGLGASQNGGGGGGGGSGFTAGVSGTGHLDGVAGGTAGGAGASCYSSRAGLFSATPTLAAGANSGASGSGTITPLPPKLALAVATPKLLIGAVSTYTVSLSNSGTGGSDATLTFYSLLPAQVAYNGVAANTTGTVSATGTPVCTVLSGTVSSGQLLGCTVSLPAGGVPAGGLVKVDLLVVPTAAAQGLSLVHKAQIDPSSLNAVQAPASCTANGSPAGCAMLSSTITTNTPPSGASSFQYTVPAGVYELRASLLGGGGGKGGDDSTSLGAVGGVGGLLTGQLRVMPGQVFQVVVGAGGSGGSSSGGYLPGGSGGAGGLLSWVYAGNGGPSGGVGGSGSGGGGGGATSLALLSAPSDLLMVAGGGGGGQGGAWQASSLVGQAGNGPALAISALCTVVAGGAGSGLGTSQDGGGGGGGGSGATAGTGGTGHLDGSTSGLTAGAGASCYSSRAGLFSANPALAAGSNRGASGSGTITPLPAQLALALSTPGLLPGTAGTYTVSISNTGTGGSNPTLTFYAQLPAKVGYTGVAANTGGTVSVTGSPVCTVLSGAVDNGPLLSCTLSLPPGGVPAAGQVKVDLQVLPALDVAGQTLVHKAQIDPSSQNAVQTPASCSANGSPAGCAVLSTATTGPRLVLGKSNPAQLMVWQAAGYGLSISNLGTLASGTSLVVYDQLPANVQYTGATVGGAGGGTVTPTGVACTASGSVTTGQLLSCSLMLPSGGVPAGGSAAFQLSVMPLPASLGVGVVNKAQLDPSGSNASQSPVACTATGSPAGCAVTAALPVQAARVRLSVSTISVGGVGSFVIRGDNGWIDQTLTTSAPNTPVQGEVQTLTGLNTATTLSETLPAGWALNSVNCVDSNSGQSGNPAGTFAANVLGAGQWQLPATAVRTGANLNCTITHSFGGFVVSGQVLVDNGQGTGTAHDGVQNGAEQGQAGVKLSLSNCSGTVYSSGQSDGAGQFSLGTGTAPPGPVCLQQSLPSGYVLVSTQGGTAGAVYNRSTGMLGFNLSANTSYSGLLFGNVGSSLLTGEGSQQLQPGQSALYAHLYTPATSASVSLSSADTPSVSGQSWNSVVYRDLNCNGQLDSSDGVITPSQTLNVVAGQQICLLMRVFSPANASPPGSNRTRLTVVEVLQPVPAISVGAINRNQAVENQTALGNLGAGLVLIKQVRKVGNCPSTAADAAVFAVSNQAAPGDYVEYQITYSNQTAGAVKAIQVSDAVPAYTVYRSGGCGVVPAGLQSCSLAQQPVVGGTGVLLWAMVDAPATAAQVGLQPGGSGSVQYCVQIQR